MPHPRRCALILLLGSALALSPTHAGQTPAEPSAAAEPIPAGEIEPEAVAALKRMSAYLSTLKTFEVVSEGSLDAVTMDGQRIQFDALTTYKARRPGFMIDFANDQRPRKFFYDGKTFTVYSPKLDFYATVAAPPTNREMLKVIYEQYGIKLPLEDLFRWNDANAVEEHKLKSAFAIGTATLDGVKTDHYAFRDAEVDWEVWIEQGERPLPRKLVIVDRTDPAHPTFMARLAWTVNPALTDADFAFKPGKDATQIRLAEYQGE